MGEGSAEGAQQELLLIAHARISSGTLPATHSGNLFAGTGRGKSCCLCLVPVGAEEIEYEVVMKASFTMAAYIFHRLCYDAWVAACLSKP